MVTNYSSRLAKRTETPECEVMRGGRPRPGLLFNFLRYFPWLLFLSPCGLGGPGEAGWYPVLLVVSGKDW